MKLVACGKESFASLGKQFNEGIVVTVSRQFEEGIIVSLIRQFSEGIIAALRRQLNQIYFGLPEREIMQEPLAQIRWFHSLPGQAGGIR